MDGEKMEYEESSSTKMNDQPQSHMVTDEPPPIFKLIPAEKPSNSDCINKLLDYLSIDDIHSLGQTCKRVEQSVGHFYQLRLSEHYFYHDCKYVGLRKYIRVLAAMGKIQKSHYNQFKSVKRANFWIDETADMKSIPKTLMSRIEHIALSTKLPYKKFDRFFKEEFCTQVKRLEILGCVDNADWLDRKYPKLEHFAFLQPENVISLKKLFELNPNIRSLYTMASICIANKSTLKKVKLDDLYIFGSTEEAVCDLLNVLHDKGTYKQLHITTDAYQENIDRISKLKSLVGLAMYDLFEEIDLSALVNVKMLTFKSPPENYKNIKDIKQFAQSLGQLEEVHFYMAHVDDILPFIHWSPKLKKVIVDNKLLDKNEAIDLVAMNFERERLSAHTKDVSKVTIYISESNYLATKWKTTETNLNLIEIQRRTSWDTTWFWGVGLF